MSLRKDTATTEAIAIERRAMDLTRWGNLGMGVAGALAAWASNSQALLIDGLFSIIGYISAVYAMRISQTGHLGPDRLRPYGYAADEALYATFRSLALLGLVLFGIAQAILGISDYVIRGSAEAINLLPIAIYTAVVAAVCFWLAFVHRSAWVRTGRKSQMLKLEATAAVYDGCITLVAGLGLLSTPYLTETVLAPIIPVMDSVLVLILCSIAVLSYWRSFQNGMGQLAGITAAPKEVLAVRRAVKPVAEAEGGRIVDIALVRLGRKLDAVVYYDPGRAVTASNADRVAQDMTAAMSAAVGPSALLVVMSEQGRAIPGDGS